MSDYLIELSSNPTARQVISKLGLPIPLPQRLKRASRPTEDRPLQDRTVVIASGPGAGLGATLAPVLAAAGADPVVVGEEDALEPYLEAGEAYGRPPRRISGEPPTEVKPYALLYDATGITDAAELRGVYEFFRAWLGKLARGGRMVVLARPSGSQPSVAAAAAQGALSGFVRSLAKEVGKRGTTAQLICVEHGAEPRLDGPLRFLLSERSAYVTGQVIEVSAIAMAPPETHFVRALEGQVALVTGAARGIGKATAKLLAGEGAHVVCLDRPEDDGPVSQVARETGGSVLLADISAPDAPKVIADALAERGGVNVVVHNAGVIRDRTLRRMKPERWDQVIAVNLQAILRVTNALLDGPMKEHGRIVCLSSLAGIAGNMGQTNYAASKAGVIGLVRQLAPEVADRGITVNAVAPGFIETRMTATIPLFIREAGRRLNSLGQGGQPQDVGEAIAFLASPGAAGVTGSVLRVCGQSLLGA